MSPIESLEIAGFETQPWLQFRGADHGYVVYEAATAKEAIKALQAEFVDLVFTDVNLPDGMNGLKLGE